MDIKEASLIADDARKGVATERDCVAALHTWKERLSEEEEMWREIYAVHGAHGDIKNLETTIRQLYSNREVYKDSEKEKAETLIHLVREMNSRRDKNAHELADYIHELSNEAREQFWFSGNPPTDEEWDLLERIRRASKDLNDHRGIGRFESDIENRIEELRGDLFKLRTATSPDARKIRERNIRIAEYWIGVINEYAKEDYGRKKEKEARERQAENVNEAEQKKLRLWKLVNSQVEPLPEINGKGELNRSDYDSIS